MPYFDHAATTPIDPRVLDAMRAAWERGPLNPSSIHSEGQAARRLLEGAREEIADRLGVDSPAHVIFVSGATEAANLALRGLATAAGRAIRIATSAIEHPCVRDTVAALTGAGRAEVRDLSVEPSGRAVVATGELAGVDLLCVMHANNETGVIQDAAAARASGATAWLCDASQSVGKIAVSQRDLGADALIASAHKLYGPAGIGCLAGPLVDRLAPLATGGPQEGERRAGTQAVALAVGFATALRLADAERLERTARLLAIEAEFLGRLETLGARFVRNGTAPFLPGFVNVSIAGIEAADLAIALDRSGFAVSPGSACSTGVIAVSPVLSAMYPTDGARAACGLRVSFGKDNTTEQATALAEAIARTQSLATESAWSSTAFSSPPSS